MSIFFHAKELWNLLESKLKYRVEKVLDKFCNVSSLVTWNCWKLISLIVKVQKFDADKNVSLASSNFLYYNFLHRYS